MKKEKDLRSELRPTIRTHAEDHSSNTQQPLISIVSSILLSAAQDFLELSLKRIGSSGLLKFFGSLIDTEQTATLSTLPLSSLLSILSIALVRLDLIPSEQEHQHNFSIFFSHRQNRFNHQVKHVVHALFEEGMEDRSEIARNSFSAVFLNDWKGANAPNLVDLSQDADQWDDEDFDDFENQWLIQDESFDESDSDEFDDVL
ncbi:hypothetical protein BLNAU_9742 [Blattamonas nauphoetae]|uniref:Uncharacterized protein n=1 Tax=Blattamonas nauphoetae TaxID=2049346 RepID=A0ABQ9XV42_9EUKA|nr:hypothetical protein BLNAU_9742 [Blattamonas nauphoetae]